MSLFAAVPGLDDDEVQDPLHVPTTLVERILSRAQLATLPQPEPLIEDTLDQRTVALLAGRNSTGKSFLALDWACCIVTGKAWQGRAVLDRGPVLYVAAEGAYGLHQRVSAWEYAWQQQATDLDVLPEPVNLFTGACVPELRMHVMARRYRLVVIDTWARSTVGGKENDNSDSTAAFERIDSLRRNGSAVLVVAHTDKGDSTTRGASALEDNADTLYRIKGDPSLLELNREKRKDGPREDFHQLRLKPVLESCVLENTRGHETALAGRTADVLSIFDTTFLDIGCTKSELRKACEEAGITSSGVFSRALSTLIREDVLLNTGSDVRPHYKPGPSHD